VDGRDAILLADQNLNGGANQDIIWEAFARRGLGYSASQGSSGSSTDGSEAFDVPGPNMSISGVSPSPIFSVGTGTLADMTGATTLLGTAQDDSYSALANIGFTFNWTGGSYTTFGVSSNGFLRLGAVGTGTGTYNNATHFGVSNNPLIAPFYDDMHTGTDGNVRYKLIGTSPNQTLVVEWNVRPWISGSTAGADRTYQAWLNEDGSVNFVYGAIPTTTNNSGYTIGYANSASDFVCVTTASGTASSATTNHTQTDAIAAGTMYTLGGIADRFIFATEAGTPSAADSLIVGGTLLTADITVTAPADFEVSTDGVNYSGSLALTQVGGTVANTMVYVRIAASAAVGSVGGDVVCSSTGATNRTQAVTGTVTADVTAPSIELVSSAGGTTDMPFTVFFNFSEPVTGFAPADITVTNASLSNATVVSTTSYSMYVTPRGTGMVTIFVDANKAQDAAGNQNTASNTLMVDYTGIPLGYCISSGDLVGEDWLKRVEIFTGPIMTPTWQLNNFSGRNGGYFNFADSVVAPNLLQGMTYNIRLSPGRNDLTRQEAYKTWVDWNQDGDYADAGELVYSRNLTDLPAVRSTFVVPATASVGYTMMRVQMKQGQVPFASCENFSRGEVEDYKINVQAPAARTATPASLSRTAAGEVETGVMALFPNPAQQQVTVQFRFNESVDATVEVYDLQGRAVRSLQFAQTRMVDANIEVAGLPQGLYLVKVMGTDGTISTQKLSVK
jgi:hypothetical protein